MPVPPPTLPSATGPPDAPTPGRLEDVLRLHVKSVDVVQEPVPRLGDDRQRPPVARCVGATLLHAPGDRRVAHDADAVRVGQEDRPFEEARLLDPGRARHLAVAVLREPAGEDGVVVGALAARQHDRHARAHRTLSDLELAVARDQRGVPDLDARDVGDRVVRARRCLRTARPGRAHEASAPRTSCRRAARRRGCPPPTPRSSASSLLKNRRTIYTMARTRTRRLLRAIAAGVLALAPLGCAHAYHGPPSDHFDGTRFHSAEPVETSIGQWLKRVFTKHQRPWRDFTDTPPGPPPPARVAHGAMRVTLVNHATVLLQMDGVNILTDPTWAKRAIPVIGPRRRRPPGLRFEDLPPIDVVAREPRPPRPHGPADAATPGCRVPSRHPDRARQRRVPGPRGRAGRPGSRLVGGRRSRSGRARHRRAGPASLRTRRLRPQSVALVRLRRDRHPAARLISPATRGPARTSARSRSASRGCDSRCFRSADSCPPGTCGRTTWVPTTPSKRRWSSARATSVPIHFGTFPVSDDAEFEPTDGLRAALARMPPPVPVFVVLDNGQSLEVPRERTVANPPAMERPAPVN